MSTFSIIPVANGGTALTAMPTASVASTFAAWDGDGSLQLNRPLINLIGTPSVTTPYATISVLPGIIIFNGGTAGQTITLPAHASTNRGILLTFINSSTQSVTLACSGGSSTVVLTNTFCQVTSTTSFWYVLNGATGAVIQI